jgi:ankyrin repeat protein
MNTLADLRHAYITAWLDGAHGGDGLTAERVQEIVLQASNLQPKPTDEEMTFFIEEAIRKKCDPDFLIELLQRHPGVARIQVDRDNGDFLLHIACRNNVVATRVIRLLVENYQEALAIPVDREDHTDGMLPLHIACESLQRMDIEDELDAAGETIRFLLLSDPTAAQHLDAEGFLPLHTAVYYQAPVTIVQDLLGAHPEGCQVRTTAAGYLPLDWALDGQDYDDPLDTIRLLVRAYPESLHEVNGEGDLPVHKASKCHKTSVQVMRFLLEKNPAAAQVRNAGGLLPLHLLAFHGSRDNNGVSVLQVLQQAYPGGTRVADNNGALPVHLACRGLGQSQDRIALLLDADPFSVLEVTNNGASPLHLAFRASKPEVTLRFLLERHRRAFRLISESFAPTIEHRHLPDLVVDNVFRFIIPQDMWPAIREELDT